MRALVSYTEPGRRLFTSHAARAMRNSRFWLGFLAGAYAVCSDWRWALLPRLVSTMFTIKEKTDRYQEEA
jgi:hypothetical protein